MKKKVLLALVCVLTAFVPALDAQTVTNTIVRFRFSYGNVRFGDVDVELFNQDKPVTVSNFLAYVRSGRYDNLLVNRLAEGFVVQAGEYTIQNPYSSEPVELLTPVPLFGTITNEFNRGTLRSNVFGTISMAKVPGDPNSASSSWFFNLRNNASSTNIDENLDMQNGGFTVFGQIRAADKAAQTILNAFARFSLYNGIINTRTDNNYLAHRCAPTYAAGNTNNSIGFDDLPVGFLGLGCINYNDLFHVQVIELPTRDVAGPKITVLSPKPNGTLTNADLTVNGTAADPAGVRSTRVYLGTNSPVPATGTNAWSVVLPNIPAGTNTVFVEAEDYVGNRSEVAVTMFHSVRVPLQLGKIGSGVILGATNLQMLELTRPYSLTVKPNPGNLFVSWTGSINQAETLVSFHMEPDFALTAVFQTNLFPQVRGVYNGLFYETNQAELDSSGFMTLTLTDLGSYSGRVIRNGQIARISGTFAPDGNETNIVLYPSLEAARLLMTLDLNGGSEQINGWVTNANYTAVLTLDRVLNPALVPTPLAGRYTMVIPGDPNSASGPDGEGFAAVKVDAKGGALFTGMLGDNSKLALKTTVSRYGMVPFYSSLYKGAGAVVSWLAFDTNRTNTDISGALTWFRQTQPAAATYKRGFTNDVVAEGSAYRAPTTNRVLNFTTGVAGITNGDLTVDFANDVTLGTDNKLTSTGTNKLVLTIAKPTGLINGSVIPPDYTRPLTIRGAVLQKQARAAGFMVNTSETSQVRIGP